MPDNDSPPLPHTDDAPPPGAPNFAPPGPGPTARFTPADGLQPHTRRRAHLAAVVLALLVCGLLSGCAVDQQIVGSWRLEHNQDYFSFDNRTDPRSSAAGLVLRHGGSAYLLQPDDSAGNVALRYQTRDGHIEVTHNGDPVELKAGVPLAGEYWFNNKALFIHLDEADVDLVFFRLP